MAATIEILVPDTLVRALGSEPSALPRQVFEAVVAQAYRLGKITHAQVGEFLGFDRWQTDAFLETARAFRPQDPDDYSADHETASRIGK